MTSSSYTPIPGSDVLKTGAYDARAAVARVEAFDAGAVFSERIGDAVLARVVPRAQYVPVLLDVFDRLAPRQTAMEQVVFLHLWRFAFAHERNFCRVSRRELRTRTQLSDRRLGKALAGLVEKTHIRLVDRDRRGTLYQVLLPHDVLGEAPGDDVVMRAPVEAAGESNARSTGAGGQASRDTKNVPLAMRPAPPPKPKAARAEGAPPRRLTPGRVVAAFFSALDAKKHRVNPQAVLEVVFDACEEGHPLDAVQSALLRFAHQAPQGTPIQELPQYFA